MIVASFDMSYLAETFRTTGRPLSSLQLLRLLEQSTRTPSIKVWPYAPGNDYAIGDVLSLETHHVTVVAVESAGNPKQGSFKVLTLRLPDGSERRMAAGIAGAPTAALIEIADTKNPLLDPREEAAHRQNLRAALNADARFAHFYTARGDLWCLVEMLPVISPDERRIALEAIPDTLVSGMPVVQSTEALAERLWGITDDGSNEYALLTFALCRALQGEARLFFDGGGWLSKAAWEAFKERAALVSPRMASQVTLPSGVTPASETDTLEEGALLAESEPLEAENAVVNDLESWRKERLQQAVLTLHARHYYEGWLPLRRRVRQLFPPSDTPQQVTIAHHFGSERETFTCWVDQANARLWLSTEMYETFREHRIYPGARLRLTAISEHEYELSTRPPTRSEPIKVWRMWRNDEGIIEYDEDEEPRQYDIDDAVFVADARFEDAAALFQQAEAAGNSIFGLMYTEAVRRWEAGGREDLILTADDLFWAIHTAPEGRMTSRATIAVELWQRRAFEPLGNGRYRFRPEFPGHRRGERSRTAGTSTPIIETETDSAFWEQISRLEGRRLVTLAQQKPFVIKAVAPTGLSLHVSDTNTFRELQRKSLESAWAHLVQKRELGQTEIAAHYSPRSSAYVATILNALPDVTCTHAPIRLRLRRTEKPQGHSGSSVMPHASIASQQSETPKPTPPPLLDEFEQIRRLVESHLVGQMIETLVQKKPNHIVAANADGLVVETNEGQGIVLWEGIEVFYTNLREQQTVESRDIQTATHSGAGYRGAFIMALLAQFTHIEVQLKPRKHLIYHTPQGPVMLRSTPRITAHIPSAEVATTEAMSTPPSSALVISPPPSPSVSLLQAEGVEGTSNALEAHAQLLAEGRELAEAWIQKPASAANAYHDFLSTPLGAWVTARSRGENNELEEPQPHSSIQPSASSGEAAVLHDLLAALTADILTLEREKQTEMHDFLNWLERQIGVQVDDLSDKDRLQDYLGDARKGQPHLILEDVLVILRKNRRKLQVAPDHRAFQQRLVQAYDDSLEKILPLKQRLANTHRLMEFIGYCLEGLLQEIGDVAEERFFRPAESAAPD